MSLSNNNLARINSAKPTPVRLASQKNRQIRFKTQAIDNTFTEGNINHSSAIKHKLTSNRSNFYDTNTDHLIRTAVHKNDKFLKDKQSLIEQNSHLKQQINKLKEELSKNRTKIETLTSKNYQYTKQFDREFSKKMYWNSNSSNNSYLISGIKAQYDKLKQQYGEKQEQLNEVKIKLFQSQIPELKIYNEKLQEENKQLLERVKMLTEASSLDLNNYSLQNNSKVSEYLRKQLEEKLSKIQQMLKQKEIQLEINKQQLSNNSKKMEFLEKLIIEKSNAEYHARKMVRKMEREISMQNQRIKELEREIQEKNLSYEDKIKNLMTSENKRFEMEKKIFEKIVNEKQMKLGKLEKEIAYLSTILTFWKPLDQINNEVGREVYEDDEESSILLREQTNSIRKGQNSFLQMSGNRGESIDYNFNRPSRNSAVSMKQKDEKKEKDNEKKQKRFPITSECRHSKQAEKKRKISLKQVEHIGQYLRYRFLGLRIRFQEIRKYLSNKDNKSQFSNPEIHSRNSIGSESKQPTISYEQSWQDQYTSMCELQQTLQEYPFELSKIDAHICSRYMIEDSNNEYVYVDPLNEQKREIIKSILKTLVGDYEILSEGRQVEIEKQCEAMMEKYQNNLLSALTAMYTSGYISRRQFNELLNSLGIELSDSARDYLVGKMLLKSDRLDRLEYMILF